MTVGYYLIIIFVDFETETQPLMLKHARTMILTLTGDNVEYFPST